VQLVAPQAERLLGTGRGPTRAVGLVGSPPLHGQQHAEGRRLRRSGGRAWGSGSRRRRIRKVWCGHGDTYLVFIRFVVGADGEHHRALTGVITEARILRDENKLTQYEEEWLEEIYDWLDANLPTPPFSTGKFPRDAVAWFKAESTGFIARMWDLVAIIEGHDVPVLLLKSPNPGKVVYEDDHQVLVEEWRQL
jgi:hypothetical protein